MFVSVSLCVCSRVLLIIIIIILFILYNTVQQQDEVCKRNTQKIQSCSGQQFNYMVVKYITMSLASHCCIVPHVIVLSLFIQQLY